MKKAYLLLAILLVTFVAFQGAAFAESVQGKISSINLDAKTLTVSQIDAATSAEKTSDIWVKDQTTFSGAQSLADLKAGDQVTVEAEADAATGNWVATSVTVAPAAE